MKKANYYLGLLILVLTMTGAQAQEIRTLDANCNYITSFNGSVPTYREVVDYAIRAFEGNSTYAEKAGAVATFRQAVKLFGTGHMSCQEFRDLGSNAVLPFDYTLYKVYEAQIMNEIRAGKYIFPYQVTLQGRRYVQDMMYYDVAYAFEGILHTNAHRSTGGDS